MLGLVPYVQVGVCGIGVGVLGSGSTSSCADLVTTSDPGGNGGGGNGGGGNGGTTGSNGGGNGGGGFDAIDAVTTPAAAVGMLLGADTLPFTGGNTMLLAIGGLLLAGVGGGLLVVRRFGYQR
jgi:hypothetical protein